MKEQGENAGFVSIGGREITSGTSGPRFPKYRIGDTIVVTNKVAAKGKKYLVLATIKAGYYFERMGEWYYCIDLPGNPLFGESVSDIKESEIVKV